MPEYLHKKLSKLFAVSTESLIFAANKRNDTIGKFINPFTDVGFKIIFGQEVSKPMLLHFLNSLLKGRR